MAIEFYKEFGPLGYLANYSNHGFKKNGVFYKTAEHYYQSEKFDDEKIKNKILNAPTPKIASNIGRDRSNIRKDNFKNVKLEVMYEGILEKFRQNREIAYKLIETRNQEIVEATIDEYYWGIGKTKEGQNHIGKILVKVREQIKKEILNSIISKAQKYNCVYIVGHQNPDADSLFSSYILSNILKAMNINSKTAILKEKSQYSRSDVLLIKNFLPIEPILLDEKELTIDDKFILVDHNTLAPLKKAQVIGAIDHHILTNEIYDTLEIEYASTGLLIYDLFKDTYQFNEQEKLLIALTCLADTEYLKSSRYKEEDRLLYEALKVNIDLKEYQQKYFTINDFSLSIEDNIKSNYKEYNIENHLIKRYLIYSFKQEHDLYFDEYLNYIKRRDDETDLLLWCDFETNKTYYYFKGYLNTLDFILTSTNLIYKKLKEENRL